VKSSSLCSHVSDLLETLYTQYQAGLHGSNISIKSGHLATSIPSFLLASLSPMLKPILLETHTSSISVHPSFSIVLPSLVTFMHTGLVNNITKGQAMMLKNLLKELGMSSNISESYEKINNLESKGGVGGAAVTLVGPSMNNNLSKRVSFEISVDDDDSFDEESVTPVVMCPPLEPSKPGLRQVVIEEVGDELFRGNDGVNTYSSDNIDVILLSDNEVDDIVENTGGAFNDIVGAEYVKDAISESEVLLDRLQADNVVCCKICDQVYKRKYNLLDHLALTHYKARLSDEYGDFGNCCPLCEELFGDNDANLTHIGRDHGVAYEYYETDLFPAYRKEISFRVKEFDNAPSSDRMKVDGKNRTSSLKGILKCKSVIAENTTPKSILRAPRPKSSTTQKSILKPPKYSKRREKWISVRGDVKVERSCNEAVLSIHDDIGDTMVDAVDTVEVEEGKEEEGNSQIHISVQDDCGEIMFDL